MRSHMEHFPWIPAEGSAFRQIPDGLTLDLKPSTIQKCHLLCDVWGETQKSGAVTSDVAEPGTAASSDIEALPPGTLSDKLMLLMLQLLPSQHDDSQKGRDSKHRNPK